MNDAHSGLHSYFMAGFECSAQLRADGVRLDLLASTQHERLVRADYERVAGFGMRSVRDGIRWHLIERRCGQYAWNSWLPMLRAARDTGIQVIWDLCHYGWPDDLDIGSADFVERFANFARAAVRVHREETDAVPYFCPINEISYWSWAGGETGRMNPHWHGRGGELKRQLVRAYLAAVAAVREVDARARFIVAEPLIHVAGGAPDLGRDEHAEAYRLAQYETHDMLTGRMTPELGGNPGSLDIIGVNFYPDNQWYYHGNTIPLGHHAYRPLREMLAEVFARYGRPVIISETGAEGSARPYWLHHVCAEVSEAVLGGSTVEGVCIYPILDYHGWDNERLCHVGLLSMPKSCGTREVDAGLAHEMRRQASLVEPIQHGMRMTVGS